MALFYTLGFSVSYAQDTCIATTSSTSKKSTLEKLLNFNLLPIPNISASPETGLAIGASVDYFYKLASHKNINTRISYSWLQFFSTAKGQILLDHGSSLYTKNDKAYIFIRGGYNNTYERVYCNPYENKFTKLNFSRLYLNTKIAKNLGNKKYVGARFYYSSYYNISNENTMDIKFNDQHFLQNTMVLGAGPSIIMDTRDNQLTATKGGLLDANIIAYFDGYQSKYAYTSINLDVRKFKTIHKNEFGVQLLTNHNIGQVPFWEQLKLGGAMQHRGLFLGTVRGNHLVLAQAEYRKPLHKYLKLAAFGALGNATESMQDFLQKGFIPSGGGGLRILLHNSKPIYLRLDVARSLNNIGYYIRIGEAF